MAAFFVGGYTSALNLSRDRVLNHDVDKAKAFHYACVCIKAALCVGELSV